MSKSEAGTVPEGDIVDTGANLKDLKREAHRLGSKASLPTVDELARYFELARSLEVPDFGVQFERERDSDTDAFRAAIVEAKRILGYNGNGLKH